MDGTQDSLAAVLELLHEIADGPGSLRVQSRGGFVEEEKEFRLGGELDSDGETFALFNVQAFAGNTYDCVL